MYQNERFEKVGSVEAGELIIKIPHMLHRIPIIDGVVYLNAQENLAYARVRAESFGAESVQFPIFNARDQLLKIKADVEIERLNLKSMRQRVHQAMKQSAFYFFLSKDGSDRYYFTLPGENAGIDREDILGVHTGMLPLFPENDFSKVHSIQESYNLQSMVVGETAVIPARVDLVGKLSQIVPFANSVYEQDFQNMMSRAEEFDAAHRMQHHIEENMQKMIRDKFGGAGSGGGPQNPVRHKQDGRDDSLDIEPGETVN